MNNYPSLNPGIRLAIALRWNKMQYRHAPSQPNPHRRAVYAASHPRFSIISLGKVIVALYVTTLLAAVISAHVLEESGEGGPAVGNRVLIESSPLHTDG